MSEPKILYATVRESEDRMGEAHYDIECRFANGEKFAAVRVDIEFPELAARIAEYLSGVPR